MVLTQQLNVDFACRGAPGVVSSATYDFDLKQQLSRKILEISCEAAEFQKESLFFRRFHRNLIKF